MTKRVAAEVRGHAAKKRLKQIDLANALHISTMAVSRRMRAEVSFTAEEIYELSILLDVPIIEFFTDSLKNVSASPPPEPLAEQLQQAA